MSYLLSQYSNCNWSATGELECDGEIVPTTNTVPHSRHQQQFVDNIQTDDTYSNLNRELAVSVYTPNRPTPRLKEMVRDPKKSSENEWYSAALSSRAFQRTQPSEIPPVVTSPIAQNSTPSQLHSQDISMSSQILWTQSSKYYEKFKKMVDKYYFQTPFQKYYDIVNELGQPTTLNPNKGGMASWQHPGLNNPEYHIFQRIDILDEECFNHFPYPHIGFLYTYAHINIPLSILNKVLSMTGDIMYDPIKHSLIVRGMSINYNIALTVLVCQYVHEKISWYNIIEHDLIKKETHHKQLINTKNQKRNLKFLQTCLK